MTENLSLNHFLRLKFIRFLLVGFVNTLFGYAAYSSLLWTGLSYLEALFFATVLGIIFNYFTLGSAVFKTRPSWATLFKVFTAYAMVYLLNAALLVLIRHFLLFDPYIAQMMCIPVTVAVSWILMNHWAYNK